VNKEQRENGVTESKEEEIIIII